MLYKYKKAFTLVEGLATIFVLSILFVGTISKLNSSVDKANETTVLSDFYKYQEAIQKLLLEEDENTITNLNYYLKENYLFDDTGKSKMTDPWSNKYTIDIDSESAKLTSYGKDSKIGTKDDYTLDIAISSKILTCISKGFTNNINTSIDIPSSTTNKISSTDIENIELVIDNPVIGEDIDKCYFQISKSDGSVSKVEISKNDIIGYDSLKVGEQTVHAYYGYGKSGTDYETTVQVKPHKDQVNSTDVAIDNNGKAVNLDLWKYYLITSSSEGTVGTYCLNSSFTSTEKGYIGDIVDGKIVGEIPAVINGKNVSNMYMTFYGISSLVVSSELPSTVTVLSSTFKECASLTEPPELANGVTNLYMAFKGCTSLASAPIIKDNVRLMDYTFAYCSNLTTATTIPVSVTNMKQTFIGCSKLTGQLVINANPVSIEQCLNETSTYSGTSLVLSGTSTVLSDILNTKSLNSNITIQ